MEFDMEIQENPDKSVMELAERVKRGEAFLVWATGITKKRQKELEKIALKGLKHKNTPLKFHVVGMPCGTEFRFIE